MSTTGKNTAARKWNVIGTLILAAFLILAISTALFYIPYVRNLEWRVIDNWTRDAYSEGSESEHVVVIGVDEELFTEHGYSWPLEKDYYADMLDYLDMMGAEAVAFDILFADKMTQCSSSDSLFVGMVSLLPQVVLGYQAVLQQPSNESLLGPTKKVPYRFSYGKSQNDVFAIIGALLPYNDLLSICSHIGFMNLGTVETDGVYRKVCLLARQDSLQYPSLSLAAVRAADTLNHTIAADNRFVHFGQKNIPVNNKTEMYINFSSHIPIYTFSGLRESQQDFYNDKAPAIGKKELDGKYVVVGNVASTLGDFGVSPLSALEPNGRSPNVMLHAYSIETILSGNAIRDLGRRGGVLHAVALVFVTLLLFLVFRFWQALILSGIILVGDYFYMLHLYQHSYVLIPVLEAYTAEAGFLLLVGIREYHERNSDLRFLTDTFKTYMSHDVIKQMYVNRVRPQLGGNEVFATAFFSDVEGFTDFSETKTPAEVIAILNKYFSSMTNILLQRGGTLDKFIGDAIVAFFGAPNPVQTHAYEACMSAVLMQEELSRMRLVWGSDNEAAGGVLSKLRMRIGINTGHFITGNIGCSIRMNYTMIGDTVNLAARLESVCKQYGVYTVVGETTYKEVKDRFHFRLLDKIRVKGRKNSVGIYQLMGRFRNKDNQTLRLIETYESAWQLYLEGDFASALEGFKTSLILERYPSLKNPSKIMIERCTNLIESPPESWDGVFTYTSK